MARPKTTPWFCSKLDEVYRPGVDARRFSYSDELAEVTRAGTFFETLPLDSDERFWVNELATYYEMLATLWEEEIVDRSLALDWAGAAFTWKLIGHHEDQSVRRDLSFAPTEPNRHPP